MGDFRREKVCTLILCVLVKLQCLLGAHIMHVVIRLSNLIRQLDLMCTLILLSFILWGQSVDDLDMRCYCIG